MVEFLESRFHITERGSTISREVMGGLVTFMAMAYIIFVNPTILSQAGMDYNAVYAATIITSIFMFYICAFR